MDALGYKAPDGAMYESVEQYFFTGVLGGCGCGMSDEIAERAYQMFNFFAKPHADRPDYMFTNDESLTNETLAHWMDSKGILEHGGSVYGSWLSPKGEKLWKLLNEHHQPIKERDDG